MSKSVLRAGDESPAIDEKTSTTVSARRAIRGGILGNYADQFDIFLPVIALAPVAVAVFGAADALSGAAWVFVATLFGRPIGAALFGSIADRYGRSPTTRIVLIGVAVTTCAIAFVPDHTVLGHGTVVIVTVLRFVGGVFLGGEYTCAVPLAMEWSKPHRRGLLSGLIMWMSPWANATIAAIVFVLITVTGPASYAAWGWRVLFVVGAAIALAIRLYYQRGVQDIPIRSDPATRGDVRRKPVREVILGPDRRVLIHVFVLMSGLWLLTDMAVPVLTGTLKAMPSLDARSLTVILLGATVVSAFGILGAGVLSTKIGRRPFFIGFGVVAAIAGPLVFLLVGNSSGVIALTAAAALLQLVTVSGYGPVGAYLSESFPTGVRSTGYGIAYSLPIVLPALYPYYLPLMQHAFGSTATIALLIGLGGLLVAAGGFSGPETARPR